jgi:hypothetical protein
MRGKSTLFSAVVVPFITLILWKGKQQHCFYKSHFREEKKIKGNLFWLLLLILSSSAFAVVNDYRFSGTIDSITGGSGSVLNVNTFSGHFVYDSGSGWYSGGDGVANYYFVSFSAILSGPGITMNYPESTFTRKDVQIRNRASEYSDWISFFADNWTPTPGSQTKIFRIDLSDYDKTVFPGSPLFPPLPTSLNLSDFESRAFMVKDHQYQFNGTVTNMTLVPEPATVLLFGLGITLLRRKK